MRGGRALRVAGIAAALLLVEGGCSFLLDPDDLRAEALDADGDVADTVADAADTAAVDTVTAPDSAEPPDTTPPPDTTIAQDTDNGPVRVVRYSGQNLGCVLDFYPAAITSCPRACPAGSGGWVLVFDATGSTGSTFQWRLGATDGYTLAPQTPTGARVSATLAAPDCALFGTGIGPGRVIIELSVDGAPWEHVDTLDFSVRQVTSCSGPGACPAP